MLPSCEKKMKLKKKEFMLRVGSGFESTLRGHRGPEKTETKDEDNESIRFCFEAEFCKFLAPSPPAPGALETAPVRYPPNPSHPIPSHNFECSISFNYDLKQIKRQS